jgi:Domain of unknown function DUF29
LARAEALESDRPSLYERDFCLSLKQQAALLREGRLDELDIANLVEEIESMGRKDKKAITSNLAVLLPIFLNTSSSPSSARATGGDRSSSTPAPTPWSRRSIPNSCPTDRAASGSVRSISLPWRQQPKRQPQTSRRSAGQRV